MTTSRARPAGFTLIELLVSISIIAILVAILMPAMSGSRKQARRTQCLTRLRELYVAHAQYINAEGRLPPLNNLPFDGAWQYNYVIFDRFDFDNNFGPLVKNISIIQDPTILFCPVQSAPFHVKGSPANPWPAVRGMLTRAGYARRYNLSNKSFSQMRPEAFLSDLMHIPNVVESAHLTGLNVAYTDGHAKWVPDPGIFRNNELVHPFNMADNLIVKKIWHALDRNP